jgi:hypothetical protein
MQKPFVRIVAPRLTAALFVAALVGCQELTAPIADPPDFTGVVVGSPQLTGNYQGIELDSVSWSWPVDTVGILYPYVAAVSIYSGGDSPTAVFLEDGSGKLAAGSVDQLAVGQRVRVWTTGVVATSDPPQFDAVQIVIEPRK